MTDAQNLCSLCGEPMPAGEEMFKFHGYSGPCPKPPMAKPERPDLALEIGHVIQGATGIQANSLSDCRDLAAVIITMVRAHDAANR